MKGDFSRSTFRRKQHYHSVRMQQGRVLLDAEANEQADIQNHLRETTARDIIGRTGAPRDHAGFRMHWTGSDLIIGAGRFYVDGILCENEGFTSAVQSTSGTPITALVLKSFGPELLPNAWMQIDGADKTSGAPRTELAQIATVNSTTWTITFPPLTNFGAVFFVRSTVRFADQPDLVRPQFLTGTRAVAPGDYLIYLDVWQRHITALDDPLIRETALGIPDTASRAKTVWQVVLRQPVEDCKTFRIDPPTGTMAARAVPPTSPAKPCEIPSSAGYRRLENQLYRVEIHAGGAPNAATFKWSRDNGSIVHAIDSFIGTDQVRLKSTALDDRLAIHQNEWVELTDDGIELLVKPPNTLVQVSNPPQGGDPIVRLNAAVAGTVDLTLNPRLRIWARPDAAKAVRGLAEGANADGFVALEDGIEVKFLQAGDYRTGDYWLIPARTAISQETGTIEWPMSGTTPLSLPPTGIVHHYAPLAKLVGGKIEDCRPIFSPESAPSLYYEGGDGQEVMPDLSGTALVKLPQDLRAGVSNGRAVAGATVQFTITSPTGGNLVSGSQSGPSVAVVTNDQGIAACQWFVNSTDLNQTVLATLTDTGLPGFVPGVPPIQFTSHLSTARNVRYHPGACPSLTATTVQDAIDELCKRPTGGGICSIVISPGDDVVARFGEVASDQNIEICFRAGKFPMPAGVSLAKKNSVTITGTGAGSQLECDTLNALLFTDCAAVVIRDLSVRTGNKAINVPSPAGAVQFANCSEVTLDNVHVIPLTGAKTEACVVVGDGARSIDIERCVLRPGQGQNGIFAANPQFVVIERNVIGAVVASTFAIDTTRRTLAARMRFGDQVPAGAPRITIGSQAFSFDDQATLNEWQGLTSILNPANVRTVEDAQKLVDDAVARMATDVSVRGQFPRLSALIPQVDPLAGRAGTAIVLRGRAIGTATICENDIDFVAVGIRAGLSDANSNPPDILQRVVLERNDVTVFSEAESAQPTIGLAVGSASSILIGGNRISSNRANKFNQGIPIEGEIGLFAVLRDNPISFFNRGVVATPIGAAAATGGPRQWRIVSNFALGTTVPWTAPPGFILENNVP